jgi:hypothetical protein
VDAHPHRWRQRLSVARGFARHLAMIDPTSRFPRRICCLGIARGLFPTSTPKRR